MTSPDWSGDPAGIIEPKASSIHRLSGSSCGAAALAWPRHSILRSSTAPARTGLSAPVMPTAAGVPGPARPNSTALRSSRWRSQNTSAGSAITADRPAGARARTAFAAAAATPARRRPGHPRGSGPHSVPTEEGGGTRRGISARAARSFGSFHPRGGRPTAAGARTVIALPPQVELHRLQQRRGIVGRDRTPNPRL